MEKWRKRSIPVQGQTTGPWSSLTLLAPVHLAQSSGLALQLSRCRSSPFSQVVDNWCGKKFCIKIEHAFKTEIPLKQRHSPQTVSISISHRNYCTTLIMIININHVQSLNVTVCMDLKGFWENQINSVILMPLLGSSMNPICHHENELKYKDIALASLTAVFWTALATA